MEKPIRLVTVMSIVTILLCSCTSPPKLETIKQPERILIIGNSLAFWNEGIDLNLKELVKTSDSIEKIEIDRYFLPIVGLDTHWKMPDLHEMVSNGDYDVIILQENTSNMKEVENFYENIRMWVTEIKSVGAVPVLYMPNPVENEVPIKDIAQAHSEIAAELGLHVAPFALSWQRVMEENPDLSLYDPLEEVRTHSNIHGTYLGACVVFATLYNKSPEGLSFIPTDNHIPPQVITEEEADFLQRVAWETVLEYQATHVK